MDSKEARAALEAVAEVEGDARPRPWWPGALVALSYGASLFALTLNTVFWTVFSLVILVAAAAAWFAVRGRSVRESVRQPVGVQEAWSWRTHWPILLFLILIPFPSLLKVFGEPSWPSALVVGLLGAAAGWVLVEKDRRR
ncbi:hypothetical protein [Corynebacterium maris]|nr:hypothetical protein [Corynebacterium maris]